MRRFVLLRHECPSTYKPSHWDFMLESDDVLQTWELRELPLGWATDGKEYCQEEQSFTAIRLADHRLAYLDYEGPLTNDRGSVTRVDRGTFDLLKNSNDHLIIAIHGETIHDLVELVLCGGDSWQLRICP